ncbi:30S ribosomal protein S6 [Lagierella massiliensis]|uniref:30S ribosomal protein S6 n=1 Tax=Lagierella massiliensis TaxID=1689303 RepID=UPI0006D7F05D|nr:30S ribosomal protein S6 [Lagierella massiliensis]
MRNYEGVVVFKPDLEDEVRNKALDVIKSTIESNGKVVEVDEWGKRKLAYEINYIKEGYYVIIDFEANPELIYELQRKCKISDHIIRYMFVVKEA